MEMPDYCVHYLKETLIADFIYQVYKFMQNILNAIIAYAFSWLAKCTLKHNTIKMRKTAFYYIVVLEIFNMGLIFMFIAYDPTGFSKWFLDDKDEQASLTNGFNHEWYQKVGKKVGFTIWTNVIISNLGSFNKYRGVFIKRFFDRRCRRQLDKRCDHFLTSDEPNTKLRTQEELE